MTQWKYVQTTGDLYHDNTYEGRCYSGHGAGLNNHAMEADVGIGPIPVGMYRIGALEPRHGQLGPFVMALTPVGHNAHGRSGFFMHGDNSAMNNSASHGCVIAGRTLRLAVGESNDTILVVVEAEGDLH